MNRNVSIWIELSFSDLKSSKLLYENGHFRTSYFFFQQATEKANKALALLGGLLSENEMKESIKHDQLKIYRKTVIKQGNQIKSFINVLKLYPEHENNEIIPKSRIENFQQSLLHTVSLIDSFRNYDLTNISTTDLSFILEKLRMLRNLKIDLSQNVEILFKQKFLQIADWIGHFKTPQALKTKMELIEMINNQEQSDKFYNTVVNEFVPLIIDTIFMVSTLLCCAIITIQHSSSTRYPESDVSPEKIYNKCLPIVENQPQFMELLESSLGILKRVNSRGEINIQTDKI